MAFGMLKRCGDVCVVFEAIGCNRDVAMSTNAPLIQLSLTSIMLELMMMHSIQQPYNMARKDLIYPLFKVRGLPFPKDDFWA
jgi:hypothetical protein